MIRRIDSLFTSFYSWKSRPVPKIETKTGKVSMPVLSAMRAIPLHCIMHKKKIQASLLPPNPRQESPACPCEMQQTALRTAQLPLFPACSEKERELIADLLTTFDEASLFTLGFKAPKLLEIGDKIRRVPPLVFLQEVLSRSDLRMKLKRILDSSVKRAGFLYGNGLQEGFAHRLQKEMDKGAWEAQVERFAGSLHIPVQEIMPLMQKPAWYDLLIHLIEKTGGLEQNRFRV